MVRRLSVIVATANGEHEHAAAENKSMEHEEEEIGVNPSPTCKNEMETAASSSPCASSVNETDSPENEMQFDALNDFDASSQSAHKDASADEQEQQVTVKPRAEAYRWSDQEMMILYRLSFHKGWAEIVASGKIPNKSASEMSRKWNYARRCKNYHPLEWAFVDAVAMVATQTGDRIIIRTGTGYDMDNATREGTWTITWQDGRMENTKKEGLLVALNVYDRISSNDCRK